MGTDISMDFFDSKNVIKAIFTFFILFFKESAKKQREACAEDAFKDLTEFLQKGDVIFIIYK